MYFDKFVNRDEMKGIVKEKGWDDFLDHMSEQEETSFFSCSTAWYDEERFFCKFKGRERDMLVGWEGVHNKVKFSCNHCGTEIATGLSCPNGCTDF